MPSKKQRRGTIKGPLRSLAKIHPILLEMEREHSINYTAARPKHRRATATGTTVLQGAKPKGRTVSLDRPYVRPIKRGKEVKSVEFGAKVDKLQVDGISFIEHLSFGNFNEGTRPKLELLH